MTTEFTYPDVGASAAADLPGGFHHLARTRTIGSGREDFVRAAEQLAGWEVHRRAGIVVSRETPKAAVGVEARLSLGVGPLRIGAPCRIVYEVDEQREKGFAYGTLPGHPESGEERFAVLWREDDVVEMRIRAFSRPATWWARLGGPVARRVQLGITQRYLRALDQRRQGRAPP